MEVCALSMKLLQESFERRAEANKEVAQQAIFISTISQEPELDRA